MTSTRTVIWAAIVGIACGCSAYWQLFTTFRFWDDEGYVLISLRNFAAGGTLYRDVFSQYGPFYNLFFGFAHRWLALPLDTAGARWCAWVAWIAITLSAFVIVGRAARSAVWGATAALAVFVLLSPLTHEPMHPVGLIVLLLGIGTAFAILDLAAGRENRAIVVATVTGALLALIKINVGIFYLAGAGVFTLWSVASPLARPWARTTLVALAGLAGLALMRPLFHEPWVRTFCAVYAIAATTTLTVLALEITPGRSALATFVPVLTGLGCTLVLVLGAALATGIGPAQLWEGIVLGPLRHPSAFSFSFRWSGLTTFILTANTLGFFLWLALRRPRPRTADTLVAIFRTLAGTGFLISFYHSFAVSVAGYLLSFGPGFIWALAAPLEGELPGWRRARQFLAVLALLQILHAFPVAGTQVSIGTALLAILLALGLADTCRWLRDTQIVTWSRTTITVFRTLALGLTLWGYGLTTRAAGLAYIQHPAESFTGARLHLSPWQTSAFATLTINAHWHGDMLFSLPGLFSFNLWTGLPTPTQANITQWWALLDETRQAEIAASLNAAHRPIIIVQRNLITAGLHKGNYHSSLLTRAIEENFALLFAIDSYEFWVRRDSGLHPLGIARWQPDAHSFTFYSPSNGLSTARRVEFFHYAADAEELVVTGSIPVLTPSPKTSDYLTPWTCRLPTAAASPDRCDTARFYDASDTLIAEVRFPRPSPQANPE